MIEIDRALALKAEVKHALSTIFDKYCPSELQRPRVASIMAQAVNELAREKLLNH